MTWTSPDRWTCPTCRVTVAPDVPAADLPDAIRDAQEAHAADHPAPWRPLTRRREARRRADRRTA